VVNFMPREKSPGTHSIRGWVGDSPDAVVRRKKFPSLPLPGI